LGPSIFILETFLQNTGSYLNNIVERTFNLQAYSRSDWIGNWTLFIFGWTIAWAPFVGLFIAKISRGRTIRQFVFGVMLVPTFFTFFWFSVFGDTALHLIINQGYSELIDQVKADNAIALFKLLEQFPFTSVASFLTVLLIALFFVTSADSGALVVDSLASGGALDTPAWQLGHPQRCAGLGTAAGRRPHGAAEHGDCQRPALRHHHAAVGRGHVARPGDREPSPEGQPEQPQRRPWPVAQASGRHSHLSGEGRSGTVHQGHRPDRHDPRRQGTSGTVLARRGPLRRGTYPRLSGGGIRSARLPLRDSPARVPASGLRQPGYQRDRRRGQLLLPRRGVPAPRRSGL